MASWLVGFALAVAPAQAPAAPAGWVEVRYYEWESVVRPPEGRWKWWLRKLRPGARTEDGSTALPDALPEAAPADVKLVAAAAVPVRVGMAGSDTTHAGQRTLECKFLATRADGSGVEGNLQCETEVPVPLPPMPGVVPVAGKTSHGGGSHLTQAWGEEVTLCGLTEFVPTERGGLVARHSCFTVTATQQPPRPVGRVGPAPGR